MGFQNQKVPAAVQVGEHTDLADWADIPGTADAFLQAAAHEKPPFGS